MPISLASKTFEFHVKILGITWYCLKITEDSRDFLPKSRCLGRAVVAIEQSTIRVGTEGKSTCCMTGS